MQKLQENVFLPPPFLTRYKPYCIQVVSPIIETYLKTPLSLNAIVDKKYPYLPIDHRSVRLYIKNLLSKVHDIYSLIMTEIFKSDLSWRLSEDLRFLEIPDHLKKKLAKRELCDLYRFSVIMDQTNRITTGKYCFFGFWLYSPMKGRELQARISRKNFSF